jgi:hypothetical protein
MAADIIFIGASIVIIVGLIYLFFHVAKKTIKWALIIFLILTIATTFFGVNVIQDVEELTNKFPTSQKLFILKDGSTLYTGFTGTFTDATDVVSFLDAAEIDELQTAYNTRNFEKMRGNHFKLILFDMTSFEHLDIVTSGDRTFLVSEMLDNIRAANTLDRAVDDLRSESNLPDTPEIDVFLRNSLKEQIAVETDEDARAYSFVQLFSAALIDDPLFIVNTFKSGDIIIYPETITFKLAKFVPTTAIQSIVKRV